MYFPSKGVQSSPATNFNPTDSLEMAGDGWRRLETAGDGWRRLEMGRVAGDGMIKAINTYGKFISTYGKFQLAGDGWRWAGLGRVGPGWAGLAGVAGEPARPS